MESSEPLISIAVITYNSANTVLETLDSIKEQTYQNIELIVSDDCSKDNTVAICKEWLCKYERRFVDTILIQSLQNTGIPANMNRAIRKCKGEWLKGIAGDDILSENCIKEFVDTYRGECFVVIGNMKKFCIDENGDRIVFNKIYPEYHVQKILCADIKMQYEKILEYSFPTTPSCFIRMSLFDRIGLYEEKYHLMEDYPFWLKCIQNGYKIDYLPVLTTYYRINSNGLTSHSRSIEFYNESFYQVREQFVREKICPLIPFYDLLYWEDILVERIRHYVLYHLFRNRIDPFSKIASKVITSFSLKAWIVKWRNM